MRGDKKIFSFNTFSIADGNMYRNVEELRICKKSSVVCPLKNEGTVNASVNCAILRNLDKLAEETTPLSPLGANGDSAPAFLEQLGLPGTHRMVAFCREYHLGGFQ